MSEYDEYEPIDVFEPLPFSGVHVYCCMHYSFVVFRDNLEAKIGDKLRSALLQLANSRRLKLAH